MKKILLSLLVSLLVVGTAYSATLTRGKTFTSNEEVTAAKLHSLVDDGTVSAIAQTDIATNYGLSVKSSTQPSDTDSLWIDTGNNCLKAYVSGAYEEVGLTPTSLATTTGTFSSTLGVSGAMTAVDCAFSKDVTISGLLSVSTGVGLIQWATDSVTSDTSTAVAYEGITNLSISYTPESLDSVLVITLCGDIAMDAVDNIGYAAIGINGADPVGEVRTQYRDGGGGDVMPMSTSYIMDVTSTGVMVITGKTKVSAGTVTFGKTQLFIQEHKN